MQFVRDVVQVRYGILLEEGVVPSIRCGKQWTSVKDNANRDI